VSFDELARRCHIQIADIQDALREHGVLAWDKGRWVFSWSALEAYWLGLRERARKVREKEAAVRASGREPPTRISVRGAIAERIHWSPWQPTFVQAVKRRRIDENGMPIHGE
jgi:hypothetical protein